MPHMCIATFRLGLRSRLVALNARNNFFNRNRTVYDSSLQKVQIVCPVPDLKKLCIGERDGIKYFEQNKFKD